MGTAPPQQDLDETPHRVVYSIGANDATPTTVISVLLEHDVTELIDIRVQPNHQWARCKATVIQPFAERAGIAYRSMRGVAKPGKARNSAVVELRRVSTTGTGRICLMGSRPLSEVKACPRFGLLEDLKRAIQGLAVKHLEGRRIRVASAHRLPFHKGTYYDLAELFAEINAEQFRDRLRRDDMILAWEPLPANARGVLGIFRPPALIVLNARLDAAQVPRDFVKYVLHHELVHYHRAHAGLDFDHTVEFYADEVAFSGYAKVFSLNLAEFLNR